MRSVCFHGGQRREECHGAHATESGHGARGRLRRCRHEQERLLQGVRRQQGGRGNDQAAVQERCHRPEVRPEEAGPAALSLLPSNSSSSSVTCTCTQVYLEAKRLRRQAKKAKILRRFFFVFAPRFKKWRDGIKHQAASKVLRLQMSPSFHPTPSHRNSSPHLCPADPVARSPAAVPEEVLQSGRRRGAQQIQVRRRPTLSAPSLSPLYALPAVSVCEWPACCALLLRGGRCGCCCGPPGRL